MSLEDHSTMNDTVLYYSVDNNLLIKWGKIPTFYVVEIFFMVSFDLHGFVINDIFRDISIIYSSQS